MKPNPAVLCYLPRPNWQNTVQAWRNFNHYKTTYPLVFYSAADEWAAEGALKLRGFPDDAARNAMYPNGKPNGWSTNNLVFWTGMLIAKRQGYSHVLYLEVDCRIRGNGWDGVIFEEFFKQNDDRDGRKVIGGTALTYSACNDSIEFMKQWRAFLVKYAKYPMPIPNYGGAGCDEKLQPVVMVNGALGVYDIDWISKRFDLEQTINLARQTTAWDLAIGREVARQYGPAAFQKVAHFKSICSLYKDRLTSEQDRIKLLMDGKVVGIHQVKSFWNPPECLTNVANGDADAAKGASPSMGIIGGSTPPVGANSDIPADGSQPPNFIPLAPSGVENQTNGANGAPTGSYPEAADAESSASSEVVTPRMSIFVVTHAKDATWFMYLLVSIRKFTQGFHELVVVVPSTDKGHFAPLVDGWEGISLETFEQAPGLGHLHHEIIKTRADEYCEGDYILHIDSDCIFAEETTPAMFLEGENPVVLIKSWAKMEQEKQTSLCWREPTNQVLGFQTTHETMQRIPMVYRRGLYPMVRRHVELLHGRPFDEFILSRRPVFPYGYSEFNALSSFALRHCHNHYHWIDVGEVPHPHNPVLQMWSHGPMDRPQKLWRDGKPITIVPIEEIKRILQIP